MGPRKWAQNSNSAYSETLNQEVITDRQNPRRSKACYFWDARERILGETRAAVDDTQSLADFLQQASYKFSASGYTIFASYPASYSVIFSHIQYATIAPKQSSKGTGAKCNLRPLFERRCVRAAPSGPSDVPALRRGVTGCATSFRCNPLFCDPKLLWPKFVSSTCAVRHLLWTRQFPPSAGPCLPAAHDRTTSDAEGSSAPTSRACYSLSARPAAHNPDSAPWLQHLEPPHRWSSPRGAVPSDRLRGSPCPDPSGPAPQHATGPHHCATP